MWDMYGLECLINLTEWEQQHLMAILKEEKLVGYPKIESLLLWAKTNSQRCYEIYVFESNDIGYDDIKDAFESNPQYIVDFIRKNGAKVYSDRAGKNKNR